MSIINFPHEIKTILPSSLELGKDTIQISSLEQQKDNLEVENARLTALQSVKNSSVAQAMTTPGSTQRVSE